MVSVGLSETTLEEREKSNKEFRKNVTKFNG